MYRALNDDTKILTNTDTFFRYQISETETDTFFPRPNFLKPIHFFCDQLETETFFRDQILRNRDSQKKKLKCQSLLQGVPSKSSE